jgi:hypothetical protein
MMRHISLIVLMLFAGLSGLGHMASVHASTVDADIGETKLFTASDATTFRVNSGNDLHLEEFLTLDGDVQLNWSKGRKNSQGGKVTVGSADSVADAVELYAWGYIVRLGGGGGGGGPPPHWDAGYKKEGFTLYAEDLISGRQQTDTTGSDGKLLDCDPDLSGYGLVKFWLVNVTGSDPFNWYIKDASGDVVWDGTLTSSGGWEYTQSGIYPDELFTLEIIRSGESRVIKLQVQGVPDNAIYHLLDEKRAARQGHSAAVIPNTNGVTFYSYGDGGGNTVTVHHFADAQAALTWAGNNGYTHYQ